MLSAIQMTFSPKSYVDRIELDIKDTTYTVKYVLYIYLHLKIDNEDRSKTNLLDKSDDSSFPVMNFPFVCSKITTAPAFRGYIFPLIRYFLLAFDKTILMPHLR